MMAFWMSRWLFCRYLQEFRYGYSYCPRALALALLLASGLATANEALVIQTDFGLKDGAVSAMKGVAFGVDRTLPLYDLTHEIPAYNIWEASYRLYQTLQYWPKGTVFVSVVDPGVGTDRKSVVLKTKSGHYIVSPDNGTLTLVAEHFGIDTVRQIDEKTNRLKGSEKSYTFHGRDVYAYTGARLASGAISYEQVGPKLPAEVVKIPINRQWPSRMVPSRAPFRSWTCSMATSGPTSTTAC